MSPCHASGFRSVPQPERSPSPAWRSPRRALTAVASSSRVSGPPSSAVADRPAKRVHLLRGHAEVALPARPLPGPSGSHEREEASSLLGREEMERAPHRPGLDQTTIPQGTIDLAGPRRRTPGADRKLSGRRDLRLDTAETTTTSATERRPIGSRRWRCIRHASACCQLIATAIAASSCRATADTADRAHGRCRPQREPSIRAGRRRASGRSGSCPSRSPRAPIRRSASSGDRSPGW